MNKSDFSKALVFDDFMALDVDFGMLNKKGRKRKKKMLRGDNLL